MQSKCQKEISHAYNEYSMQITQLLEVLHERCTADLEINPTDLRRILATDRLSAQQLWSAGGGAPSNRVPSGIAVG
jgi:hypothetical protein